MPAAEQPASAIAPAGVPASDALESRGATIGRVDIYVQNIFDLDDPREDRKLYRLANRLHYTTRERTVREQLLFAPGDRLAVQKLAETERILRSRRYLNDAWVVPVAYDAERNVVDVAVTVRDVWTLNPGLSLGRSGGSNRSRIEIDEQNLLGTGTKVAVSRSRDVDRTSTLFSYFDSNLRGSWLQLGLDYEDNSDGKVKSVGLVRPFYALDTRSAFGFNAYDGTSHVSLYSNGQVADQFEERRTQHQAYYGWSRGLQGGWTQRWYAGLRYEEEAFGARADLPGTPLLVPPDRKFVYPWAGWQVVEDRYEKSENVDLLGRTEDLFLGRSLYAELGYSNGAFGGHGRSVLTHVAALDARQFGTRRDVFLNAGLDGRLDDGVARNVNLTAGVRYFDRITPHQVFYASLSGSVTRRLDPDQQLLIGGDLGLRGYPLRFQGGTSSAVLTLEHRVFTGWYPFRLVQIGGAVFFDAGRTWGRDFAGAEPLGLLRDVGLGIRIGNNRSGLGNVLHVDFSYALDAPPGVKRYQVSVGTKDRF